ncbi:hypothetical protein A9W95_25645 [Mycobacterium sp. 1423905.2]|nr:hypothetical protein A9W95_25645 [Mycobacterium sp. 1423905.2]
MLRTRILPTFGDTALCDIRVDAVSEWHATTSISTPVMRIQAYSLFRSIMADALTAGLIKANPCQVEGVSTSVHATEGAAPSALDIERVAAAMPKAYRTLVSMGAWLAIPFSELTELRRKDVDLVRQMVRVRRSVGLFQGVFRVTTPNSSEGIRDIAIPEPVMSTVKAHLDEHVYPGRESLLFPSVNDSDRHLSPSTLYPMIRRACVAAGRPELRVSDLQRYRSFVSQRHMTTGQNGDSL